MMKKKEDELEKLRHKVIRRRHRFRPPSAQPNRASARTAHHRRNMMTLMMATPIPNPIQLIIPTAPLGRIPPSGGTHTIVVGGVRRIIVHRVFVCLEQCVGTRTPVRAETEGAFPVEMLVWGRCGTGIRRGR